jgi:hypothetical protein
MCVPGLCIKHRRGAHVIPTLVWGKLSCTALGLRTKAFIAGKFEQMDSMVKTYNIVLTIITINSTYTIQQSHNIASRGGQFRNFFRYAHFRNLRNKEICCGCAL